MNTRHSNLRLLLLLSIFVLPILLSWALYLSRDHWNFNTTNYGKLMTPPISVSQYLGINTTEKWQLIYVKTANCDAACQNTEHLLHQIQKALGKNYNRINVTSLISQDAKISNKIYIVDPQKNLLMYYPDTEDPMHILKDIKHLLEVSQIG